MFEIEDGSSASNSCQTGMSKSDMSTLDDSTRPKESSSSKKKKTKKEKKREKKKKEGEFVDVTSMPGVKKRIGAGMVTEYKANDPHNGDAVHFIQKITDMGKFKRVELTYERDCENGLEKVHLAY